MAAAKQRVEAKPPRLALKVLSSESGQTQICAPDTDDHGFADHVKDAFGTSSNALADSLIGQLGAVVGTTHRVLSEPDVNAALAAVDGIGPQNEAEAMLAVQMVATHNVAMNILTRAKFATTMPGVQEYGSLATKLLRTFTTQVETLAKLRRGGEEKVKVEHVHVHEGGQAIVGNVSQSGTGGGGDGEENWRQPCEPRDAAAIAYAPGTPMWSADPHGNALPAAGDEEPEALSPTRRSNGQRSAGRSG
jgi:hypothetical protein